MIAKTEVKDIFPTPLWIVDLLPDAAAAMNAELKRQIYGLTEPLPPIPVGGTWQTDPVLHKRPEFVEFCKLVNQTAKAALDFLKVTHAGFEITGCWANINPQGGLNSPHSHPNNVLSGVYYVSLPNGAGKIQFHDPRPQAAMIMPRMTQWNKYVGNQIEVETKEGRFVVFPAWLEHSVPVNRDKDHRISISFNIMFSHYTETMSRPLWKGTASLKAPGS
jgi:uncharacterized protein (TIGR02466 family)